MAENIHPQTGDEKYMTLTPGDIVDSTSSYEIPETGLHRCGSDNCNSDLVYPVDWQPGCDNQTGRDSWEVILLCPNCEWTHKGIYQEDEIAPFDALLDKGTEALTTGLEELTRANLKDDFERIIRALQAGQILPEDF